MAVSAHSLDQNLKSVYTIKNGLNGTGRSTFSVLFVRKPIIGKNGMSFAKFKRAAMIFFVVTTLVFPGSVSAISVSQEKELAKEFLAKIKKYKPVINDPLAADFISEIGRSITAQVPPQPFDFSFRIINEEQFNAFAGPGANIFINRGLITSLDNVDELAGILAHETGHAVCRHVSQMIDRSKFVNIGTLAGMLAGVLMGASGGGDIAQGMVVGSAAVGQSTMLAFSRENETEADQKGLVYASKASFSPGGLLTSLEKIRANDWYGTEKIPGYLKTHPGSKERIVSIQSWIDDHYHPDGLDHGIDPFRFEMIKYRLAGLYGKKDQTEKRLAGLLEKEPDNPAIHYGMALVLARKSVLNRALDHLKTALSVKPFDPMVLVEMGRIYCLKGEYQKALTLFTGLDSSPGIKPLVWYYRGRAHLETGSLDQAEEDFSKVIETDIEPFPRAYYNMANVFGKKGSSEMSHFYLGLYFHQRQDMKNSCFHLKKSLETLSDPEKKHKALSLVKKCRKQVRAN